jgi:hypothetical protein
LGLPVYDPFFRGSFNRFKFGGRFNFKCDLEEKVLPGSLGELVDDFCQSSWLSGSLGKWAVVYICGGSTATGIGLGSR